MLRLNIKCLMKDTLTPKKFIKIMDDNDFTVSEVAENYSYKTMKKGYIAKNDDYKIEFYTFDNVSDAVEFYGKNAIAFSRYTEMDYEIFYDESDGKYKVVERVENTVFLINVDKKYKKDVEKIIEKLGY